MRYSPPDEAQRNSFHAGTCADAYRFLGAHPLYMNGEDYLSFAVWAPNAKKVSLIGEFCDWNRERYPMEKQFDGIWEIRLPERIFKPESNPARYAYFDAAEKLKSYKYAILGADNEWVEKADPFAFECEMRPHTASKICNLDSFAWSDEAFIKNRKKNNVYASPVNIYEMHLGTWRRKDDGTCYTYAELAELLIPYLQDMNYTHVEFLPVMEHPLDASWGYQVSGYFAPTSRYGKPDDFRTLVNRLHEAGISVILDWVPAHFPKDDAFLRRFDGTPLFEHPDPRRSDMPQWGTLFFDYGRGEVCSFLMSSANFWFEQYHVDGLRCDAVSSMLYLDFCREPGQFLPNKDGGNMNYEAIEFIRNLNRTVYANHPGVMMIAEESSAYPLVTHRIEEGGLGFGFKWNMGWMNDMLSYVKLDPVYRSYHHHDKLTFSMMYAFSENFILPFSHDEVVHGKHSMLDKQPGDIWQKFAGWRALYAYQIAHPGKKLLFMGGEFGQFIEWKDDDQLDWFLLLYEKHPEMQKCVRDINAIYRTTPAFYQQDQSWDGFEWLNADDTDRSVVSFIRRDKKGKTIVCLVNFTPTVYEDYRMPLPQNGVLRELINTDDTKYAGSGVVNTGEIKAQKQACMGKPYSVELRVPPLAAVYFTFRRYAGGRKRIPVKNKP